MTARPDVFEVARRYGVKLQLVPQFDPRAKGGPTGQAALRFAPRAVCYSPLASRAAILHEVMHVVLTPTRRVTGRDMHRTIELLPEEFVLLQVERAVARAMDEITRQGVIAWQIETEVWLMSERLIELRRIPDYEQTPGWRGGLAVARSLGVLDDAGQPTWWWPRWTKPIVAAAEHAVCGRREELFRTYEELERLAANR